MIKYALLLGRLSRHGGGGPDNSLLVRLSIIFIIEMVSCASCYNWCR